MIDGNELESYLSAHGQPERVEVLVADCNAIYRGKWFGGDALAKLCKAGTNMPISLLFGDLTCETPSALLQPPLSGDPDTVYTPVAGSLKPVPWRDKPTAQLQLEAGNNAQLEPRQILTRIARELNVTVALEGEFYLTPFKSQMAGEQVYSHEMLAEQEGFVERIYDYAGRQGVPVTSVLPEYGNGQFEVNLDHSSDPVAAADAFMAQKRVVKAAAQAEGKQASFMAQPYAGDAGSGLHIHVSWGAGESANAFQDEGVLESAIAGLIEHTPSMVALVAPHANSYRRIGAVDEFTTANVNWGENHRGVMVRIPKSDVKNRRFEFRMPGADANPYLVTACVLAAAHDGIMRGLRPNIAGAKEGAPQGSGPAIPTRWLSAIDALDQSAFWRQALGESFVDLYVRAKRAEEGKFHSLISNHDLDWGMPSV